MKKKAIENAVTMDLAALGDAQPHLALDRLNWPTDYAAYHDLSRGLIDAIADTIRNLDLADDASAAVRAKAYDVVTDLAFITRLALDIANTRRAGRQLRYDPAASPLLTFLDKGGDPDRAPVPRVWHHPVDLRLKTRARKAARQIRSRAQAFRAGDARIDVHNRNNLVNTVLQSDTRNAVDWPVANINWRTGGTLPNTLGDAVAELTRVYAETTTQFIDDADLCATLEALGRHLLAFHFAKSWTDLKIFERHMASRPMGLMLLGGTPKHLGRLAGWLYRRTGRPVARCAHGGERVFFSDYEWGLAEFPDCDIYYTHSAGERDAIAERFAARKMALVDPHQRIDFRTVGSPHHQELLRRSIERPPRQHSGTVVYVAGGYLGEQLGDFPNRKPPDILYLDWQIDLVRALQALDYRVVVKPHPAGIAHAQRFLEPYADEMYEGSFDPIEIHADAFVFDFAGTAFFDTLATNVPMILVDMGVRPLDPNTRDDLAARCALVPATRDDRGRFRVVREQLGPALGAAIENDTCPPGFHDRYFGA
ncbi:MAG: hypothetical protein VW516_03130 [Rhodospirillaceae bacterium]